MIPPTIIKDTVAWARYRHGLGPAPFNEVPAQFPCIVASFYEEFPDFGDAGTEGQWRHQFVYPSQAVLLLITSGHIEITGA